MKNFKISWWNLKRLKKKRVVTFFVFLSIMFLSAYTQTPENKKIDKAALTIKPNSRDVNVRVKNNAFQRIDRQRKQHAVVKKTQQLQQKRVMKKSINQTRRQEIIQRRHQMMQQRNVRRR